MNEAGRTLITVSGTIPATLAADVEAGRRPRADYEELRRALDGVVVDRRAALASSGWLGRAVARLGGTHTLLAWTCFRRRRDVGVVFTDGEQVGLIYAVLARLRRQRPRHVMIGHLLSTRSKTLFHRVFRVTGMVDRLIVYASAQREYAIGTLGYAPDAVVLHPFMVDTAFWDSSRLQPSARPRPMICAAGKELRDYHTLIEAVRGLDVDLVIAAASPWSRRRDTTAGMELPENVTVNALDHFDLRQLYADATFVVVPLVESDFQAGITTILEAMSMGRAVICSSTKGQTDTIVDGETGLYVAPHDPRALRESIVRLLDDPETRDRLGSAARAWACASADVEVYARELGEITLAGRRMESRAHDTAHDSGTSTTEME